MEERDTPNDSSIPTPDETPVDSPIQLTNEDAPSGPSEPSVGSKRLQQQWSSLVAHEGFRRYLASLQPLFELEDMEVYTLNFITMHCIICEIKMIN
ncbi:hypothetical protein [Escherichia coli]|uniref:hypothetical protein n=1 Tax=Escherichia coli TaxID=562 RepID=UPI0032DBE43F